MALIQDIADGISYAQISQTYGIRTEQIPRFASTWVEQDFGREEGIRENRHMELMFEVMELRAEIAEELAQPGVIRRRYGTQCKSRGSG